MEINTDFLVRFCNSETKLGLRIAAAKQNKSMNELLNDIVTHYLEKNKEVV
jgi:plasmid stability protein